MVTDFGHFQTADDLMKKVLETAQSVALTPAALLIFGESGSGKSSLVQMIAEKSRQRVTLKWTPFKKPNFLDFKNAEICLIEDLHQFNFIQQTELNETIDALKEQGLRVRWIATTSQDLSSQVHMNSFRRDLFFRLSVIQLKIPSLKERSGDVRVLASCLTDMFCVLKNETKKVLSAEALEKLSQHSWPGNVTELENVIERAVSMTKGDVMQASAIEIFAHKNVSSPEFSGTTLSEMEKKLIIQTLQLTHQNKTRAAQILGISIRTLRNKLNEYREAGAL